MTIYEVIRELKGKWYANDPLEDFTPLDAIEASIGRPLPADYKYFLQWFSDGGEADLPGGYLRLYPASEVMLRQKDFGIDAFQPDALLFGMEGDHVFCFDLSRGRGPADYPVLRVSLSSRDASETTIEATSFADFLEGLISRQERAAPR